MIDWSQVDTVMLDMDGTLLDLRFDNHFWHNHVPYCFACKNELDIEQAREHVFPKYRAAEGTLDWYCVDFWSRTLGLDIIAMKGQIAHRIALRPRVPEFLDALKKHDLRLVTNAHRKTLEIKMAQTGLSEYFALVVCAHEYGAPKEHPEFWAAFHARHPFDRERTLFIDDSLPVLRAARDFGVRHLLAVRQPDSGLPAKDVEEFDAVADFAELIPA